MRATCQPRGIDLLDYLTARCQARLSGETPLSLMTPKSLIASVA